MSILATNKNHMDNKTMQGYSIGLRAKDITGLIQHIKQGLPVSSLTTLSKNLGIPEHQMASAVNISRRTLANRKKRGKSKVDESERAVRLAMPYERAKEILESDVAAKRWFHSPVKGLDDKIPFEVADTEPGAQKVMDLLGRIEDGVFS
jgi:putative toxin-antitoxin system antitoxin component (TIGR02293 family)